MRRTKKWLALLLAVSMVSTSFTGFGMQVKAEGTTEGSGEQPGSSGGGIEGGGSGDNENVNGGDEDDGNGKGENNEGDGGETEEVATITLNQKEATLELVGAMKDGVMEEEQEKLTLTATVSSDTFTVEKWESDKPEIATVDENGVVTPLKDGEVTITAIAVNSEDKKITAECKVNIIRNVARDAYESNQNIEFKYSETGEDAKITTTLENKAVVDGINVKTTSGSHIAFNDKDTIASSYCEVNLGEVNKLDYIKVYTYWDENGSVNYRVYKDVAIVISNRADFKDATVVYTTGSSITKHKFADKIEQEDWKNIAENVANYKFTKNGLKIELTEQVEARYIRVYMGGNNTNQQNHIIELEAWGKSANYTDVTDVTLEKEELVLYRGGEKEIIPTITPTGAYDKKLTWTSTDEKVATVAVDDTGKVLVQGVGVGETTITAMAANGLVKAECKVTVAKYGVVLGAALEKDSAVTLFGKEEEKEIPTVSASGNGAYELEDTVTLQAVANTENYKFVGWRKAITNKNGEITGVIVDNDILETTTTYDIKISDENNGINAYVAVYEEIVAPVYATEIQIEEGTAITLEYVNGPIVDGVEQKVEQNTLKLTATVKGEDEGENYKEPTYKAVVWNSENPEIATVDTFGRVTPLKDGEAIITATTTNPEGIENKTVECKVNVIRNVARDAYYASENTNNMNPNIAFNLLSNGNTAWDANLALPNAVIDGVTEKIAGTTAKKGSYLAFKSEASTSSYCEVNLGEVNQLDYIKLYSFWDANTDGNYRLYHDVAIVVSNRADFSTATVVYTTDGSDSKHDLTREGWEIKTEIVPNPETISNGVKIYSDGLRIKMPAETEARYIRVYMDGCTGNGTKSTQNYIIELEAWGTSANYVDVTAVELLSELTLYDGNEKEIEATITPADAKDPKLTWISTNEKVATVTAGENGKATIKVADVIGEDVTTTIIAMSANGLIKGSCTVTVAPYSVVLGAVAIKEEKVEVEGEEESTYTFAPITGDDAPKLLFSGNNAYRLDETVTLQAMENTKTHRFVGWCKAVVEDGNVTINTDYVIESKYIVYNMTVEESADGKNVYAAVYEEIPKDDAILATGISLDKTEVTLKYLNGKIVDGVEEEVQQEIFKLTATVTGEGEGETYKEPTYKAVVWKSENPEVATVNEVGVVTPVSEGIAIITATTTNPEDEVNAVQESIPEGETDPIKTNFTETCTVRVIKNVARDAYMSSETVSNLNPNIVFKYLENGKNAWNKNTALPNAAVDGEIERTSSSYIAFESEDSTGTKVPAGSYCEVNLGEVNLLDYIKLYTSWETNNTARIYHDVAVVVSKRADFADATVVYATGNSNEIYDFDGKGWENITETVVDDYEFAAAGLKIDLPKETEARYVRVYMNGCTSNNKKYSQNHIIELEAWGRNAGKKDVTSVEISENELFLYGGSTAELTKTVTADEDVKDKEITWFSENPEIATVEVNENGIATVTAVGSGTTNIVAMAANGLTNAKCKVTVAQNTVVVGAVTLDEAKKNVTPIPDLRVSGGGAYNYKEKVTLKAYSNTEIYVFVGWYTAEAKVDEDGKVSIISVGESSVSSDAVYKDAVAKDPLNVYLAVYELVAEKKVEIAINDIPEDTVINVKVNKEDEIKYSEEMALNIGDTVTLTATGTGDFIGWKNAYGIYVTRDSKYTFVVTGDATFTPVYNIKLQENAVWVVFESFYKQEVLRVQLTLDAAKVFKEYPEVPKRYGYEIKGWLVGDEIVTDSMEKLEGMPETQELDETAGLDGNGTDNPGETGGSDGKDDPDGTDNSGVNEGSDGNDNSDGTEGSDEIVNPDETEEPQDNALSRLISKALEDAKTVVTITPAYDVIMTEYTVSVTNGTIKDNETNTLFEKKYKLSEVATVVADDPAETKHFSHWIDETGKIVSYNPTYAFYIVQDVALTAVYVDDMEEIKPVGITGLVKTEKVTNEETQIDQVTIVSLSTVPKDYKMHKAGVILAFKDDLEKENSILTDRTAKYIMADSWDGTSYRYTLNLKKGTEYTVCVRAYLVYSDNEGNMYTVYGDVEEL